MTVDRRPNARGLVVATVALLLGFAARGPAARANWEVVGTAGFSAGAADYTCLTFYNGEPYVAYADGANGSKATVMRYTGKSWETVGDAGFSAGAASYVSLAFCNDEPYVAYEDAGNGDKATVMHYTGKIWETVGEAGFSADAAYYTSLAIYKGEPYVAYVDVGNKKKATVMRYTGGSWEAVGEAGFSVDEADYTSLVFHNDEPYVAYRDAGNGDKATVMRYTGKTWEAVGEAGFSGAAAYHTSLAICNGEPHVAYVDVAKMNKATVMRYTGGSWEAVGKAGFSAGEADFTSLAFCNGEPYVAYSDAESKNAATVMRYTGGSWQTVGTAGFSAGSTTYTVLAFDGGEPHVAYMDGESGNKATVMRYAAPPTMQATNVTFSSVGATEVTIDWTRGDGSGCVAFVKQASSGSAVPADNTTYTAGAAFGTGTQIGATGWYCVCNGSGTSVTVTGLSSGTTYRVMVCEYDGAAGNEQYCTDTAVGNPANVTTDTTPTVTTAAVSDITTTSATCGGNVTADGGADVTARGVCWSRLANPTTDDSKTTDSTGTGAFVSSITGLSAGTTYHVRAYATNSAGTAYGSAEIFTTVAVHTVTFQAGAHGSLTGTTTQTVVHGVDCTPVTAVPDANHHFTGWTGDYIGPDNPLRITNVTSNLTITANFAIDTYIVAFQAGAHGSLTGATTQTVAYGADCTPVTALPDTNYHFTGWTGGYVGPDNPLTITNVTADMTISANFAIDTHTVTFDAGAHGALQGTTCQTVAYGADCTPVTAVPDGNYHFAGWTGDYVGSDNPLTVTNVTSDLTVTANFTTDTAPTVTTAAVSDLTTTTATCGGIVTTDGGANVTARGVCWSTSATPTTADSKTSDGAGTGAFVSSLSGLSPGTTYHVRAYARNSAGTAYGSAESFTTAAADTGDGAADDGPPEPDLLMTITSLTPAAEVGDDLTFQVAVENVGDALASGVLLRVPLPPGTQFVSARWLADQTGLVTPLVAQVEVNQIVIELGALADGENLAIELVLRALAASTVTLQVSAAYDELATPVTARADADVQVADEYWEIVNTVAPVHICGWLGATPLLVFLGLTSLKRRGWARCGS